MRFRYFDSEGTEVGLSSVDALRFRIQTGVVTPETLLYDAAAGQWAPARQNPLFRFLIEEEEDLLPEEHRSLMGDAGPSPEESGDSDPSPGPEPGSTVRWPSSKPVFDLDELDAVVGHGVDSLEGAPRPAGEAPGAEEASRASTQGEGSGPDESGDDSPDTGLPEDDSGFPQVELTVSNAHQTEKEEEASCSSSLRSPSASQPATDRSGAPTAPAPRSSDPARDHAASPHSSGPLATARTSVETSPPAPSGTGRHRAVRHRSFPSAPPDPHGDPRWFTPDSERSAVRGDSGGRRRSPSLAGIAAFSVLMVFAVGIPILMLGGGTQAEDGAAYALVGRIADDLTSGEGSNDADAPPEEPAAAESIPEGPSDPAPVGATVHEGLDAEEMEALAADVDAAAVADLEDVLANLRVALRVPETPPAEWLQGPYLAEAAAFPRVERYWMGFSSLVASMEELEEELYRGFVQRRVLGTSLDSADASRLSARVLARYEGRSQERAALYRDLALLASSALALHDTLVVRSDDIVDRSFDGTTLTRYPFMAAAPGDPVLAEQIWSRVDEILDLFQGLEGTRPTSTTELRAAVRRKTPGGAGDPAEDLPDWWRPPAGTAPAGDRRSASVERPDRVEDGSFEAGSESGSPFQDIPEVDELPIPTQEISIPD